MSAPLLEQLPHLADLQRYLEQLSFMEPPVARSDLILQQVGVVVGVVTTIVCGGIVHHPLPPSHTGTCDL